MYKLLRLLFGFLFLCFVSQSYGSFQIVELYPNTPDDKNLEYIIIQNISQSSLSLSGYILSDTSKDYVIMTDEILESGQQQKFLRPETKLILNNSNEEVFLNNIDGELIDAVSYEKTIKGEILEFEVKETLLQIPDNLISDEVFISGEVLISDEVIILSGDTNNDSNVVYVQDEFDGEYVLEAPAVLLWLQRPSYISLLGVGDTYICDDSKNECKVNFDLRDSFTNNLPEKDYICQIDFGVDGVLFGEEEKCNPNTVIFPEGEYEIIFKIYHQDDETIFSEKKIFVKNLGENLENSKEDEDTEDKELSFNPSSSVFSSVPLIKGEDETQGSRGIKIPEIVFGLQRPSYISYSGTGNVYDCDSERDECKVNFDLRESFGGDFSEKDYTCKIDFGFGELTGEEEKCNPNTITFPYGNFQVTFLIYQESKPENFTRKMVQLYNPVIPEIIQSTSTVSQNLEDITPRIQVGTSNFIVQSGLVGSNFDYYCVKDTCKINLKYSPKYKDEKCFWNFAGGTYSHPMTLHKCNPSYVTLPEGAHDISLKVYDSNYEDNFIIFPFTVHPKSENLTLEGEGESLDTFEILDEIIEENTFHDISLGIQLQGKISKNKTLSGSVLTCTGVEKCSVNLLGIVEGNAKGLEYIWKLNGEIFSEKLNPSGIWVEGEGYHEISFQVGDIQELFYVDINSDSFSDGSEAVQDGVTVSKEPKIKFTQNFLALKYDGLRISGLAPAGSKIEIYHHGEKLMSGTVDEKGKYRLVSKAFKAGEHAFDTKIILSSGEEVFLETSGEFILKPEKRAYWFVVKKTSSNSSSSFSSSKVPPKLVVKESDAYIPEVVEVLSLRQKILIIAGLLFLGICMILHMITKTSTLVSREIFSIYLQQFSVKHKITLILP